MKLNSDPKIPDIKSPNFIVRLYELFRDTAKQVNILSSGGVAAVTNATSTVPTAGDYQIGDFVRNSTPSELGGAGSKYIVFGWIAITAGNPATFRECRFLTGN